MAGWYSMIADTQLEIAQLFANVACDLALQQDIDSTSDRIAHVAAGVLGCPWVQVVQLTERGTLTCPEPADAALRAALRISSEQHEGIVSEAVTGGRTVVVDDFATDDRWPHYKARILRDTPIRSALAYLLRLGGRDLGVLAMYSPQPGYFTDRMQDVAALLADHAAIAVAHASASDRVNNLEIALSTNRKIGVAIGVLMARMSLTHEQAFDLLRTTSQHTHRKLRDVAEYVEMTGELPTDQMTVAAA